MSSSAVPAPLVFVSVLAAITASYAAFIGWCAWRTARAPRPAPTPPERDLPSIAVLVAARDEEATIGRCLDALLAQDYPADRLTVVVADDHSADRTAEIVKRVEARTRRLVLAGDDLHEEAPDVPEVRYLRVPDPEGGLRGKALAIHTAVNATDAPVLLVTDADCAPAPGWARGLVAELDDETGLVGGLTLMETETAFEQAQSLDWGLLLGAASALTEAGFPATAMGNNLAIRREAYEEVGGYPGVGFSVTEDHALFSAIAARTDWRLRFPIRPDTLVRTLPARSLGHAYRQRRRWARGGLVAGPVLWAVYVLAHLAHLIPLVALAVSPVAGVASLAVKLGADALHLGAGLRRSSGGKLRLGPFLLFEAWLFSYLTTLPVALLLAPRIRWKGRVH